MAKVAFNKLNKVKNMPIVKCAIGECDIEVEQYLPLEKKLDLMTSVIEQSGNGEEGFFNIVKLEAYYRIEMIKAYTNISFTDKQLEDTPKLFDLIELNGIWAALQGIIPASEQDYIWNNILNLAKEITSYNSSALGIIKAISNNRDQMNFDIEEIFKKINSPDELATLKEMMNYTGLIG